MMEKQKYELDQELVNIAMEIIVEAGEARLSIGEALGLMGQADFDAAEEKLKQARGQIAAAHERQTEVIHSEGETGVRQHPLLFIHAQDTLMTINSELNLCRRLKSVFQCYESRIAALEKQIEK